MQHRTNRIARSIALALAVVTLAALAAPSAYAAGKVKVFILAGQSNMQGHGRIAMGKEGDLDYAATQPQFSYLKKDGQWVERDDVFYYHLSGKGEEIKSKLKPGLGANETSIGPELAFGHVMGDHFDEPVLLIKTAWGGQAIGMTFRPPSSGTLPDETLQDLLKRRKNKNPDATMDDVKKDVGSRYRQVLEETRSVITDLGNHFPELKGKEVEIVGFFWHQGWNDGCSKPFTLEYEKNMTNFIKDMRRDLGNDNLPFVIATSGMGGPDATGVAGGLAKNIEPAQVAASEKYDNCVAVKTRHFQKHKPGRQKSHWHNSAESYCLVGDAAAKAMLEIIEKQK